MRVVGLSESSAANAGPATDVCKGSEVHASCVVMRELNATEGAVGDELNATEGRPANPSPDAQHMPLVQGVPEGPEKRRWGAEERR